MALPKIRLVRTCASCPEQYDAYLGEEKIAYLRLRHGFFRVECRGRTVYSTDAFEGDGSFAHDHERRKHLNTACREILAALDGERDVGDLFTVEDRCPNDD